MSIAYWSSVNPGSIKVLIEGIDQHLTVDAFCTHNPLSELMNELAQQQQDTPEPVNNKELCLSWKKNSLSLLRHTKVIKIFLSVSYILD